MSRSPRFACHPLALAVLMLTAQAHAQAQNPAATEARLVEIPAQPAAQALQLFVKQQNFQLLYAPELVRGLTSKPVSGTMHPRDALNRMLEGSGLQVVETGPNAATLRQAAAPSPRASGAQAGSGAASGSTDAAEPEADSSPKPAAAAAPAARVQRFELAAGDAVETVRKMAELGGVSIKFKDEDLRGIRTNRINGDYTFVQAMRELLANTRLSLGQLVATNEFVVRKVEVIAPVEVTGSHLRSIVGEQGINQVEVLTRQDIERSGVTTLAELRNLIPQLSVGASASFDGNSSRGAPDGRLLFNLRGLGQGNALILVDGLRLPRTGSRTVAEAYEATGIPMSAIERVEVLLGGGSAIYGADAVGGVVNIITRKRYRGTEVEYALDNTMVTDAANNRLGISHAFRHNKFSARASVSVETQNALALRDREWLATDDRRWLGGSDGTANNLPMGGYVQAVTGNLPGIGKNTAYIPAGANGKTATIADYLNAPATARYDAGKVLNAVNEYKRGSATAHAEYEFSSWAQVYADFMWSKNESEAQSDPVALSGYTLPVGYQGNPFGVPIRIYKYMWELGTPIRHYTYEQQSTSIGLRGDLPKDWRYRLNLADARSKPSLPEGVYQFHAPRMNALINGATPPVLLHDSYALVGNEGAAPNTSGVLESAYYKDERYDTPVTRTYSFSLDGPAWQLQAGTVNLAVGLERRVDSVQFTNVTDSTFVDTTQAAQPKQDRITNSSYLETSVPLLSPKSSLRIPLVHSLSISGAVRRDSYNDFGAASKKLLGGQYKPVSWMSLRGSRNEAFRVPYLIDITRPRYVTNMTVPATGSSALIDLYRKNEPFIGTLPTTLGGSNSLKPEQSVHYNVGLQIESPFEATKGLSFSVDRWRSKILDRVGTMTRQEYMLYFPDAYSRAALTPEDAAAGYTAGKITGVDFTSRNISKYQASGYDYSLRYVIRSSWGEFSLNGRMTRTDKLEVVATPAAAPSPYTNARLQPKRVVATVSWAYRGAGVSVTGIRQSGFPVSLFPPIVDYPGTTTWNTNVWYDFGNGGWHDKQGLVGRLMGDTRISLGLINATDVAPPLSPTGQVNSSVDPRLMRYTFTLRRRF